MKKTLMPLIALELVLAAAEDAQSPAALEGLKAGDRFDGPILEHSQRERLNPRFVKAIIAVESEFSPRARSSRGARGLMQLMPQTAQEMGVAPADLNDPASNIQAGTAYLNCLYRYARRLYGLRADRLHDAPLWVQRRVLAAYNGGPRMLLREKWPGETRRYVAKVMRLRRSAATTLNAPPNLLSAAASNQRSRRFGDPG